MKDNPRDSLPARFAAAAVEWSGSTAAFMIAFAVIVVWAVTGPLFGFSDTWQLVINTGTTIVTFLMVFLLQRAQNNDSIAVHLKLNEILAATQGASNRLIAVEDLSEDDRKTLRDFYCRLVERAKNDLSLGESHSADEAEAVHKAKSKARHRLHGGKEQVAEKT